jgi:large subunit ribosomal protein L10
MTTKKRTKIRPEKKAAYDEIRQKLSGSVFVILADYKGLTVAKTTELKKRLRGAKASIQVVKNRVFGHVAKDIGMGALEDKLSGPSAMVYGQGDVVQAAKVLKDFVKEHELPVVKIGTLQGVILTAADVAQLASLPSREVLLSKFVGTLAAPLSNLVGVLNQKAASLVYVLQAAADKKGQGAAAG